MKKIIYPVILTVTAALTVACNDPLELSPDDFISTEEIFRDADMTDAVVANFYGRVRWGQHIDNNQLYIYLDEACLSNGSPSNDYGYADDFMRVYDYTLIREINEFLAGLRSDAAAGIDNSIRLRLEGEARFLRAWTYFNMVRSLGGVPLVGDRVFEYKAGMNVADLQLPRSTEAATYDYIISECRDVADNYLGAEISINSGRANRWTALALCARAALYAGSLAHYNAAMSNPIATDGEEVGIPAAKATEYYNTALNAAREIIGKGPYDLYRGNVDKMRNFYEATSVKTNNCEVMWAFDHVYPGDVTNFSLNNVPTSAAEDESSSNVTPILNLVEAFEYKTRRDGTLATVDASGNYIVYDSASDLFADKDPRLWGTIIYPGSEFKGTEVVFQAGRILADGTKEIGATGSYDAAGNMITSINGPTVSNDGQRNKSGFCIRKFLDETDKASTRQGSGMWFPVFRYSEILLIAAEAAMEIGDTKALDYINEVRDRAGIQRLSTLTIDDIVRERRVELAFEGHRYWDMKRLRKAHVVWNGDENNTDAVHYALFPYRIFDSGSADNGKWIFDKQKVHMTSYPRYFQLKNYYNFFDQTWLSNNPKLVKNPYQ